MPAQRVSSHASGCSFGLTKHGGVLVNMALHEFFDVSITRFLPKPTVHKLRLHEPLEFEQVFRLAEAEDLILDISAINESQNMDYGNMTLFTSTDRAFLRLLEHRDFVGRDPQSVDQQDQVVRFRDESGDTFQMNLGDTISKAQALEALRAWLSTLEQPPGLSWR